MLCDSCYKGYVVCYVTLAIKVMWYVKIWTNKLLPIVGFYRAFVVLFLYEYLRPINKHIYSMTHSKSQNYFLPYGSNMVATESPKDFRYSSSAVVSPSTSSGESSLSSWLQAGEFLLCQRFINLFIHRRKWGGGAKGWGREEETLVQQIYTHTGTSPIFTCVFLGHIVLICGWQIRPTAKAQI